MMYAQRGHGKRSSFYSDYTFGLWHGEELVPVGKAYFGFTDAELLELDRWVRNHTVNRFGPVREVERGLVLEVAFEGLQRSTRHKSGLAMRFPRINRIRWDKPFLEADKLADLGEAAAGGGVAASERRSLSPRHSRSLPRHSREASGPLHRTLPLALDLRFALVDARTSLMPPPLPASLSAG